MSIVIGGAVVFFVIAAALGLAAELAQRGRCAMSDERWDWCRLANALSWLSMGVLLALVVVFLAAYATGHPVLRALTVVLAGAGLLGLAGARVADTRGRWWLGRLARRVLGGARR